MLYSFYPIETSQLYSKIFSSISALALLQCYGPLKKYMNILNKEARLNEQKGDMNGYIK